jgi:hypothetical protein
MLPIFISAQPDNIYFQWQTEVQIVNFRKFGLSRNMHVLVWHRDDRHFKDWENLQRKYPEVGIYLYPDKGSDWLLYRSIIRPHILKQHFKKYPELQEKTFFYHDSDIIFNYLPDFGKLMEGDISWQSNTSSYLDYTYLRIKEIKGKLPPLEAINTLCKIGGISTEVMRSYKGRTGGAQYLLKGSDSKYWQDVENQCVAIRKAFYHGIPGSINARYFPSEDAGFQSWCADMWAVNMALWKRGVKTGITPELGFSWATDSLETYKKKPIYHNAGVTQNHKGYFNKSDWRLVSPIGKKIEVVSGTASEMYVKAIREVK